VFNLLPGQGLGFSAAKEVAFGLGAVTVFQLPLPPLPNTLSGGGGGMSPYVQVFDNAYSHDDDEIVEILTVLFQVIQ